MENIFNLHVNIVFSLNDFKFEKYLFCLYLCMGGPSRGQITALERQFSPPTKWALDT